MTSKGFRPGVGNIATYSEGKLRKKMQLYANEDGFFNDITARNVTFDRISQSVNDNPAQSNVFLGDLVVGAKNDADANVWVSGSVYVDKIRRASDSGTTTKILLNDEVIKVHTGDSSNEVLKIEAGTTTTAGKVIAEHFSGSTAQSSVLLGDLVLGSKDGVNANLFVSGNLTIKGTTTTIDSTVITVEDPIFTLGGSSAPDADDNKDRGVEFHWHNGSAAKRGFFGFDDSTTRFTFIPDASNSSEVFTGTPGAIEVGNVLATRFSQSAAESSVFLGDVVLGAKNTTNANLFVSGNLGVGTTSTLSASINTNGNIRDVKYSNGSGARSSLRLAKARGSEGSPSAVTDGHSVGQVEFSGYDGANYVECASIVAKISGTPGSDDMPGALHFLTTPNDAKEATDRMVITEAGNVYLSGNVKIADDKRLYFGTHNDCFIEYDEGSSDYLVISGSDSGMVLSGSTIQIRGTLEGASPLQIAGGIEIIPASDGTTTHMTFGDNIKTTWGDDDDSRIQFKDSTHNIMEISGSSKGIVLSGSYISIDGRLGIGVVADDNEITHALTLPNTDDVYGKIIANAYTTYSSARYKKDIQPIENALDMINNIEGVTYKWQGGNAQDIGFIAEEVGKTIPEIVEWDADGVNAQSMDYTRITPVLVEAMKEQQAQIKKQKKLIEQLFEKIEELKKDS